MVAPSAIVVIGASLGGTRALQAVLPALPAGFPLPIAVVLHRSADSEAGLGSALQQDCRLTVVEAEDKQEIERGHVYLAPAGYHLLIEGGHCALSIEEPVNFALPSIDVLFESAADSCGERVVGVVLTGNSSDGAEGLATIKRHGGLVIVQDPATAEGTIMPAAAIAATKVDEILPLIEIGPFLARLAQ
ncbi:MAG: chemotaxis protein CheB [Deltaproteobacteria bacterium]|nr:chemotaxis protein CheB [Deltaproteobacteria bacterium]